MPNYPNRRLATSSKKVASLMLTRTYNSLTIGKGIKSYIKKAAKLYITIKGKRKE